MALHASSVRGHSYVWLLSLFYGREHSSKLNSPRSSPAQVVSVFLLYVFNVAHARQQARVNIRRSYNGVVLRGVSQGVK